MTWSWLTILALLASPVGETASTGERPARASVGPSRGPAHLPPSTPWSASTIEAFGFDEPDESWSLDLDLAGWPVGAGWAWSLATSVESRGPEARSHPLPGFRFPLRC